MCYGFMFPKYDSLKQPSPMKVVPTIATGGTDNPFEVDKMNEGYFTTPKTRKEHIEKNQKIASSLEDKKLREQILELIIQHDPRTCLKVHNRILSPKEMEKFYESGSKIVKEWGKIVNQILALIEEDLPELAKEAGYKLPEEIEEIQAELTEKFATKFEKRIAGYVSPEECKQCNQRQIDSEKILNREAAFDEKRLRDEVQYWKVKNYVVGGE